MSKAAHSIAIDTRIFENGVIEQGKLHVEKLPLQASLDESCGEQRIFNGDL